MKKRTNDDLSRFVGASLRHALRREQWFFVGYLKAQREQMIAYKELSFADYVRGWKQAGICY
jgi:hypothetical protein